MQTRHPWARTHTHTCTRMRSHTQNTPPDVPCRLSDLPPALFPQPTGLAGQLHMRVCQRLGPVGADSAVPLIEGARVCNQGQCPFPVCPLTWCARGPRATPTARTSLACTPLARQLTRVSPGVAPGALSPWHAPWHAQPQAYALPWSRV